MKSTLRTGAAAVAMLLAPIGAMLVAQPASAQPRHVYVQPAVVAPPVIERFVLRHAGRLEPGHEVRFRLVGAPGGRAWLAIPGVLRSATMTETRPGVYEAEYVVRRRDNRDAFARAVATLQSGGQRVSARVEIARPRHGRDERAPQVTQLTPSHGERVGERRRTRVSARFSDEGSGVEPGSVVLRVDGRDVTDRARVDGDNIRYAENLQPGRHVAELMLRDRAGNPTRRSWTFEVVDRGRDHGYYGGDQRR